MNFGQWLAQNWVQVVGFVGTSACTIASWFSARKSARHEDNAGSHAQALRQGAELVRDVLNTITIKSPPKE